MIETSEPKQRRDPRAKYPPSPPALLTIDMVIYYFYPASTRTIEREIATGEFPAADASKEGERRFWHRATIEAWKDRRGV